MMIGWWRTGAATFGAALNLNIQFKVDTLWFFLYSFFLLFS